MGDSISKFKQKLEEEEANFQRMKNKLLMYGNTPEESIVKSNQKFKKRKLPFTK